MNPASSTALEVMGAVVAGLAVVLVLLASGFAQLRERVARIEEWIRIKDRHK